MRFSQLCDAFLGHWGAGRRNSHRSSSPICGLNWCTMHSAPASRCVLSLSPCVEGPTDIPAEEGLEMELFCG
eukprot:1029248-Rhodomonas_salina.2